MRIEGSMAGNQDSANRIAFYADEAGKNLVKIGWLNTGGWSDKYIIDVTVPRNAKYLFVSSPNGMLPSVRVAQNGVHYYIADNGILVSEANYQIFYMQLDLMR